MPICAHQRLRALPGLRVEDTHHHYLADVDGRTVHLRGDDRTWNLAPFANFTDLKVAHRTGERTEERKQAVREYRQMVVERGIEALV